MVMMNQPLPIILEEPHKPLAYKPPQQLLKWIGNKQRFAQSITSFFPHRYNRYFEPFLGSGAVLGAMAPDRGYASDTLKPLISLWNLVKKDPGSLSAHYEENWHLHAANPREHYVYVLKRFNSQPNPLDFLYLTRACYGGVVRFTKSGLMSTPVGPHRPIPPVAFNARLELWRDRVKNTTFTNASFEELLSKAGEGDIVYCDPPYVDSQAIIYGAQSFSFLKLLEEIEKAKYRGAKVALSIDGFKKSKKREISLPITDELFERRVLITGGSSMLRRLQKKGEIMVGEDVHEQLLLTW